jgi:hypothetical protein
MKLDITDTHFIELQKKGITMDMVLILSWLNQNLSITHIKEGSKKIDAIYKTMVRKDLISPDTDDLTRLGMEVITFIGNKTNKTFLKPKVESSEFDEWWSIFPPNDKFEVKGKKFGPTRAFKTKKDDCRTLFNKLILDEKFTAEEIINATKYDINLKKDRSYTTGSNQLKYLQNSYTYLYQKTFDGFVGMGTTEEPRKKTNLGSIDI